MVAKKKVDPEMALAAKFHAAVAAQLEAIERIAKIMNPTNQNEIEPVARASASVAHSLRETKALIQPDNEAAADDDDDDIDDADPIPRDIDTFRDELERRIRGIIETQRAATRRRVSGAGR
jgi:hypothetical protein